MGIYDRDWYKDFAGQRGAAGRPKATRRTASEAVKRSARTERVSVVNRASVRVGDDSLNGWAKPARGRGSRGPAESKGQVRERGLWLVAGGWLAAALVLASLAVLAYRL